MRELQICKFGIRDKFKIIPSPANMFALFAPLHVASIRQDLQGLDHGFQCVYWCHLFNWEVKYFVFRVAFLIRLFLCCCFQFFVWNRCVVRLPTRSVFHIKIICKNGDPIFPHQKLVCCIYRSNSILCGTIGDKKASKEQFTAMKKAQRWFLYRIVYAIWRQFLRGLP